MIYILNTCIGSNQANTVFNKKPGEGPSKSPILNLNKLAPYRKKGHVRGKLSIDGLVEVKKLVIRLGLEVLHSLLLNELWSHEYLLSTTPRKRCTLL